ncbi:MAG: selenocysteine-specific translation elongation factor [Chloroflexota bacterium]
MRVIGTAGHVDHGKSTLVRRLTGMDPDRLAEEKKRQLTIDLGFTWFDLNGERIGIVDVPGHRDFIENMLAGVGGLDAIVLVVAADEGVMPQTREHLAIIDLLGVETGLVVLTKCDLVNDADWLDLVEIDLSDTLRDTVLQDAPIIRLSAVHDDGLEQFNSTLADILQAAPSRPASGRPRLPVDRVFTVSGFGTVVTGTLTGGALAVGDTLQIQPSGLTARVRGLQSYHETVHVAEAGTRVAVNLSGVDHTDLERGDVLAIPGTLHSSMLVDAHYRHLPDASRPLRHNAEVKVFSAAAHVTARVRLLDAESLEPGDSGWVQLRLDAPLALARDDRYILRFPSPAETIGGGVIVDPQPRRRHRRFSREVIDHLQEAREGTPLQRLIQAAIGRVPLTSAELAASVALSTDHTDAVIEHALHDGQLIAIVSDRYLAAQSVQQLLDRIHTTLRGYHNANPLHAAMPREALRAQLAMDRPLFDALLALTDAVHTERDRVRLRDHRIQFTARQQQQIDQLMQAFEARPYTPPGFSEAAEVVTEPVLYALIELGEVVAVNDDVIFTPGAYHALVAGTLQLIETSGSIDAKTLRDRFDTSRKYAIALLEHLDSVGITRRQGDVRVRGPQAADFAI